MSKLKVLYKYNFLSFYNRFSKIFMKKGRKLSKVGLLSLSLLLGIGIYAFIILYLILFATMFAAGGVPEGIFYIPIIAISMLSLMSGLTKSNSYLFRMRDYDMLMSMPIKSSSIIISKISMMLVGNVGLSLLIWLPTAIIYSVIVETTFIFWIASFVTFIFIPLFPLIIGSFISYLFGFIPISNKAKNMLSSALYVAFIIVFIFFNMQTNPNEEDVSVQVLGMIDSLKKVYFLAPTVVLSVLGTTKQFILYNGICLILTIGFIAIVSISFRRMVYKLNYGQTKKVKKVVADNDYKSKSTLKALIKKELSMFVNYPVYILNSIIGPIMSLAMTVLMSIKLKDFSQGSYAGFNFTKEEFILVLSIMLIFSFTLQVPSSSTISVEGKSMWILKSSPVRTRDLFASKLMITFLVTVPVLLIDVIIAYCIMGGPLYIYLVLFFSPLFFITGTAFMGLYLNLCFPKFNYDNVQKVIKNSLPVVLTIFLSFALIIVLFIGLMFSITYLDIWLIIVLQLLFGLIYVVIFWLLLSTKGIKKYMNLNI